YPCTSKKKNQMIASIASQEALEHFVEKVITAHAAHQQNPRARHVRMSPSDHHSIAKYARATDDLTVWLSEHQDDPAVEDFIPRLKDHLLTRICGITYDGDEHNFSDADCASVLITDNKLFQHSILRNDTGLYSRPTRMDFLLVRWFRRDSSRAGWAAK
ncbi:hypothetical protein DEU56DRAFT_736901, partial [Suillus clintonianus]|uniref:uncharacterized protein n=1 Tax=Suillus clintonianus TaxID=1904413 RepID=UPI001B86D3E2